MNISYNLRESAPYSETTSSGFTTFPLLLLILCARAINRILGSPFSTKESPDFITYVKRCNLFRKRGEIPKVIAYILQELSMSIWPFSNSSRRRVKEILTRTVIY
jgi:hypothetical protein